MVTKIIIECDEKEELLTHLDVLKEQISALTEEQFEQHVILVEDNNCYGSHAAEIYTDDDIDVSSIDSTRLAEKYAQLLEEVAKYMDSELNDVLEVWYTDPPILLNQIKEALGK